MTIQQRELAPAHLLSDAAEKNSGREWIAVAGGTIVAGNIVCVTGNSAAHLKVERADADTGALARNLLFVAMHGAATGQQVRLSEITCLRNVNTNGATIGDPVFLSGTAGGWSLTAGAIPVAVGIVVKVSATVGIVVLCPQAYISSNVQAIANVIDSIFRIVDDGDITKKMAFQLAALTTGTTRTWTVPDVDLDFTHVVRRAFVSITPAQVRALAATQIALVAAPGAGKYLEFISAHLWLDFVGVAHNAPVNAGDDLGIRYTDGAGQLIASAEATGFINAAADAHRHVYATALGPATNAEITPVANAAIVLDNVGAAEFAGAGDSPLKVEVFYRVRTLEPV